VAPCVVLLQLVCAQDAWVPLRGDGNPVGRLGKLVGPAGRLPFAEMVGMPEVAVPRGIETDELNDEDGEELIDATGLVLTWTGLVPSGIELVVVAFALFVGTLDGRATGVVALALFVGMLDDEATGVVAFALLIGTPDDGAAGAPPAHMPFHAAVHPGAGKSMPVTAVTSWHCWPLKLAPRQRG